jgi:asparagine synthase (glutamine-hydrolysing)
MCGIAGILAPGRPAAILETQLSSMSTALQHRGPDGAGSFIVDGIALGHTRLAIIDLSEKGQQPMANEDGNLYAIVNGEIYNYRQLRTDLQSRGHRFRSRSDSEVVLHLYEEYGDDCVRFLEGMFALALWDARRYRMLLARDFSYVPAPMSIFKGVQKVLPAERVVWEDGKLTREIYWRPQPVQVPTRRAEAAEALGGLLDASVQAHLVSDVPVTAFLSGGVDSSTVVAVAQRHTKMQTFCVSFPETGVDESPIAKAVAAHLGTKHQEVTLSLDPVTLLSEAVAYMDEPFADSSALPTFAVCQAARQVAKVVLSGDGGDEVFGGYTGRYRVAALQAVLPWPRLWARGLRCLPPWRSGRRSSLPEMLDLASQPDAERFVAEREITSASDRAFLFGDDSVTGYEVGLREVPAAAIRQAAEWHPVHRALWMDLSTSLSDDILTKVDRMSMAHGLEVRVPFLDHHLVELALSLPPSWLVTPWPVEGKRLLRDVTAPLLPQGILNRPKQGFVVPLNRWLQTHFSPMLNVLCLGANSHTASLLDGEAALDSAGLYEVSPQARYALLVLEMWLRHVRNARSEVIPLT